MSTTLLKKVNIVDKEKGTMMRTPISLAQRLVDAGTHNFTSKGKLKSFLNRQSKLYRNSKTVEGIDFKDKKCPHKIFNDPHSGKTYIALHRKDVEKMVVPKNHSGEVDMRTMLPIGAKLINVPIYQLLVANFPN